MAPRFRAEHIGSLIRPSTIVESSAKGLGSKQSNATIDNAVHDVLKGQIDRGITPLTNGEYPRRIFFGAFFDQLEGFETRPVPVSNGFRPEIPVVRGAAASGQFHEMPSPIATSKIKWTRSAFMAEWDQIRGAILKICNGDEKKVKVLLAQVKITILSPIVHHIRLRRGTAWTSGSGYTRDEDFFSDLTSAYQQELTELYNAGCRYVQVDDPDLTYFCDESFLDALRRDGLDPDQLLSTYVKAHNDAIKNRPVDMTMGVHLCRGNLKDDLWLAKGSYEKIASRLFQELEYDAFFLEYETEKAGSFAPLRLLPKGKTIVLGVISTKEPELEDLDVLERRVRSAAKVIAEAHHTSVEDVLREQVAVSPQCGFASSELSRAVGSMDRMWEKLGLVKSLAQRISI